MAVYSGFYPSVGTDREYGVEDIGKLFDGIIKDGVYSDIGQQFRVTTRGTNVRGVDVGTGRGWFKNTWIYSDSSTHIDIPTNISQCYIVIEINKTDRVNRIRWVTTLGSNTNTYALYPIARITGITNGFVPSNANIQILVGTSQCPYVTGPLKSLDVSAHLNSMQADWITFKANKTNDWELFKSQQDIYLKDYLKNNVTAGVEEKWRIFRDAKNVDWSQFKTSRQNEWYTWLNTNTAQFKNQWDTWYYNNTVGKSERWEAWYAKMTADSEKQWDDWFFQTTDGQLDRWMVWWEEHHKLLSSNMIKIWWEWWNPWKEERENEYTDWYENLKNTSENQINTWFNAVSIGTETALRDWWNEHIPIYENQWNDWWNEHIPIYENQWNEWWESHPPVYEGEYLKWKTDITEDWDRFKDSAEKWFEDFTAENDTRRYMFITFDIVDENGNPITDANGHVIQSKNKVVVI